MASAVFEGTSLVNMFVRGCWVNGIRRLIVSRRGDEEEFFEIRTEWSDRSVLYLHRSLADLGRLWQRLRDAFPEDRSELARGPLRQGAGPGTREGRGAEATLNCTKEAGRDFNRDCDFSLLPTLDRAHLDPAPADEGCPSGGVRGTGSRPAQPGGAPGGGAKWGGKGAEAGRAGAGLSPWTSHFRGGRGRQGLSCSQGQPGPSPCPVPPEGRRAGALGKVWEQLTAGS